MEEEGIKSAFEIAMERISRMPELTPGEIAAQKEKECGPLGLALSNRFLEGAILECELVPELNEHPGDQVAMVRRILIENLSRSIDPEDKTKSLKALSGIRELLSHDGGFPESAAQELEQVLAAYDQAKARESARLQALGTEHLRQLGISGTAVRPNVEESAGWQQAIERIRESFEPRLDRIRKAVVHRSDP